MTQVTLLDGAVGQELVKRSPDPATPLWSTQVMMDDPDAVEQVHATYFRAGATVATTNSYALHRNRLERVGMADRLPALIDIAVARAGAARDAHGAGRIAGALGPLLASYRPDLQPDVEEARRQYGALMRRMQPGVDLFLHETVCSLQEAEGALLGTQEAEKPVWIAFSVEDEDGTRLRSGESLAQVAPLIRRFEPAAVLINCSRPEVIAPALEVIKTLGTPFGAYANGFTGISDAFKRDAPTVDVLEQRQDLDPVTYAAHAMGWVDQGATIVGGCCEVGPDHIRELAQQLRAAGHDIV